MAPKGRSAEAICSAMGLMGFVEPDWTPPMLRLLVMPSFSHELCVTVDGNRQEVSTTVLAEPFWGYGTPSRLARWNDQAKVEPGRIEEVLSGFATAHAADQQSDGRMVCITDGWQVECCLFSPGKTERFGGYPDLPILVDFVRRVLHLAWTSSSHPGVKNGLADCARFAREKWPREIQPAVPVANPLLVVGSAADRAEYLRIWRPKQNHW